MANISIEIKIEKCKGCGLCVSVCPKSILSIGKDKSALNKAGHYAVEVRDVNECIGCVSCALVCPDGVIGIYEE